MTPASFRGVDRVRFWIAVRLVALGIKIAPTVDVIVPADYDSTPDERRTW